MLDRAVPPGEYIVVADLDGGGQATYGWPVDPDYRGDLTVIIGSGGKLWFEEQREEQPCAAAGDLPYAVPGRARSFRPGTATIDNQAGGPVSVTLGIGHDSTRFFECAYDLTAAQQVSLDGLTATAGEYDVTVAVGGGEPTDHRWEVRPADNYPMLVVQVREDDTVVGCGTAASIRVRVSNEMGTEAGKTLALNRDGEQIAETTVDVAAGSTRTVGLGIPVGGVYTLTILTGAGNDSPEVVECYCFRSFVTTVTVTGDGPTVESTLGVCD